MQGEGGGSSAYTHACACARVLSRALAPHSRFLLSGSDRRTALTSGTSPVQYHLKLGSISNRLQEYRRGDRGRQRERRGEVGRVVEGRW